MASVVIQVKNLPIYSWQQARTAYLERQERVFVCSPRYPVHLIHTANESRCGANCCKKIVVDATCDLLFMRCMFCDKETSGGLFEIGIQDHKPPAKRLFSDRQRWNILSRDNNRCQYCGAGVEDDDLVIDHIVPFSLGGPTDERNGVTCCATCNSGKADTFKVEVVVRTLIHTHIESDETFVTVDDLWQVLKRLGESVCAWKAAKAVKNGTN